MMMYQLLTTVSSNKVTAKRKGEREKGRDQTHFVKVRFKGPFFTPLEYRAPKRWRPHSSGRGLQKRQARPSPSTRPTEDAAVLARPRALCPSSLRWSRAGGGGGSGERAPAPSRVQIWEATRAPHLLEKQGHISPLPPTPAPPQDPKAQLCGPDLDDAKAPWQVAVAGSRRATMGL